MQLLVDGTLTEIATVEANLAGMTRKMGAVILFPPVWWCNFNDSYLGGHNYKLYQDDEP